MNDGEIARHIGQLEKSPAVVFTFDSDSKIPEELLKASATCLTKPINENALLPALNNAKSLLCDSKSTTGKPRKYLLCTTDGKTHLTEVADIQVIEDNLKQVELHCLNHFSLTEESLHDLEDEFWDDTIRIHRYGIVFTSHLERLEKTEADRQLNNDK